MRSLFILAFIFLQLSVQSQNIFSTGEPLKIDVDKLVNAKLKIASNDPIAKSVYQALIKKAEDVMKLKPRSVMDKTDIPPSGSKHDYVSLAPYWWPDPAKPNGLPYIKKDGLINPEVKNFPDKEHMPKLCENVYLLGLAYYFSGNDKYAQKASEILSVWFIDTATRMNPNLNFAQMVKGINNGRGTGIIDTRHFNFAIDGIHLIESSKYWTKDKSQATKKWFTEFLYWLDNSPNGVEEKLTKNNHGIWYDAQCLGIALYVDNIQMSRDIVKRSLVRLDEQCNADHLFPLEMERTNSLHYSTFNLVAFSVLAQLAEKVGVNFWETETEHHHSLHKAYTALLPYLKKEKVWTLQEITPFDFQDGNVVLYYAYKKLNCIDCLEFIKKNTGDNYSYLLLQLL
jgi:hypothetical protein